MAKQKASMCMRTKSVTLEGASTQDADQESNQEMHEASTQDVPPVVRATCRPSKYLDIWDLPDDQEIELPLNSMHQPVDDGVRSFTGWLGTIARKPHMCPIRYLNWKEELKEECWHVVERKYSIPRDPIAYAALKTFTLQKIGEAWRDHKCRLKSKHYIPHSRNKAWVKNNQPKGCIPEDWDVLVEYWYTNDAVIKSEKNKDRCSKQDDLHVAGSCSYAVHAAKVAKVDGRPVECAALYSILHTCKGGSELIL